MFFSNTPRSATVLQHHRADSNQAFLLPPDVLEAAGSCWRCNILHPAHLWFQPVTVSSMFLKEHPLRDWFQWFVVVLFQLLPGFSLSEIKHESLEAYDCAVLEQKARTVTSAQVWTEHLGASYFTLCPWARTQHLGEKGQKAGVGSPCGEFIAAQVGPCGRGAAGGAARDTCRPRAAAPRDRGVPQAPGGGGGGKRREKQADQSPRGLQWHLLFLDK